MGGAIFSPVFGRGVVGAHGVNFINAGDRHLALLPASLGLGIGMHLFVARADFTECEYLGKMTGVADPFISFEFAARTTRNNSVRPYIVFAPEAVWQATSVPGSGGLETSVESGIETMDTTGKELLHTRTRESREFAELTFRDVRALDWESYKAWVSVRLSGGLYRFHAAYMDHDAGRTRCDLVKLREPGAALTAVSKALVLRNWSVGLAVVQRDYWLA